MKAKSAKRPRPHWITCNKVLVALYWLANEDGLVETDDAKTISRAAKIGWAGVESALEILELDRHIYIVKDRLILADSPAGERHEARLEKINTRLREERLKHEAAMQDVLAELELDDSDDVAEF